MIRFKCSHCHQRLAVPESHAGKRGKCPKCGQPVSIPKLNRAAPPPKKDVAGRAPTNGGGDSQLRLVDIPKGERRTDSLSGVLDAPADLPQVPSGVPEPAQVDAGEAPPQRKLPWVLDIFLYPTSVPGLLTLGVIIAVPLLVDLARGVLGFFGPFLRFPAFLVNLMIGWYYIWYVAECVRDSAHGGIRAPETLGTAPGIGEMFWQSVRLGACYLAFAGPAFLYLAYVKKTDAVFYALLGCAVVFLPIGLLSVVLFDSFVGFNPLVLIGAVLRTLIPYFTMVALFWLACGLFVAIGRALSDEAFLLLLLEFVLMYLALVAAHILGRFYWRYQDKLNWDV